MTLLLFAVSIKVMAQFQQKVSLNLRNVQLSTALDALQKQVKAYIVYNHEEVNAKPRITLKVKDLEIDNVLERLLAGSGLRFSMRSNSIVIGPQIEKSQSAAPYQNVVTGEVVDEGGKPLPGATIAELGADRGTISDENGRFRFELAEDAVFVVSYLGMADQRIYVAGKSSFKIVMKPKDATIDQVVVTGIPYNRRAESFTGAATKITREELLRAGNVNIFQSLKNLEPSLNIQDNLAFGSDPNKMPEMQIRGVSSFPDLKGQYATSPNQPLFIVDGFEVTIEKVSDLNMNRIESVTILKDASAKALYGSRAANGVIVIETVKVKPGELRINYTATIGLEVPDLGSYNLANASEKIDLERQLGAYDRSQPIVGLQYDSLYYANLKEVQSGVNTDWLAQPVRTGISNKHTLGFEVGDDKLRAGVTLYSNKIQGVMIGSERKSMGAAISLTYRYKNILFRNLLQYTGVKAANSPYGEFSEYAKLNPYWRPFNADGTVRKFLGIGPVLSENVYNPMYNATLNTASTSEYTDFTNNTYLEWTLNNSLKVIGRVGFSNTVSGTEVFMPGSHTLFNNFTGDNLFLKGTYDKGHGKASMLSGDINVNYSKIWGRHILYTNIGANIREDNAENYLYSAMGFPNDKMDNIIFAKQYALNGKPSGTEAIDRELGGLAAVNYAFDNRYLVDLSVRTTASSQFGAENRWGSFWSAGAGWNLHNEKFLQGNNALTHLKLRGSMGYTGSQHFNSYQAMLLYSYFVDNSYQGMLGTRLDGLANKHLKWQQKLDYNVGMDAEFMSRLNVRVDVYNAITTNLLTDITTPPSLGFSSYKANLGQIRNSGVEFKLNYRLLANASIRRSLNLFASGISNKNKIVKISNSLQSITSEQDELSSRSNKPLVRFQEGQSLDAIWAVPSRGIDPATGKEIFVKADGSLTDIWNANDKIVAGINQPALFGNLGANYEYKGFSIGVIAQYRMGGQIYNQTLVDKVENAQLNYNVDKRAYYDSWKAPGDNVLFKSIGTSNALTLATSRFVQDFSELNISSVNIGYDFYRFRFVEALKLERLQVMINMNDIYRFSNVRLERGTAYPFARYGSFTVMANF